MQNPTPTALARSRDGSVSRKPDTVMATTRPSGTPLRTRTPAFVHRLYPDPTTKQQQQQQQQQRTRRSTHGERAGSREKRDSARRLGKGRRAANEEEQQQQQQRLQEKEAIILTRVVAGLLISWREVVKSFAGRGRGRNGSASHSNARSASPSTSSSSSSASATTPEATSPSSSSSPPSPRRCRSPCLGRSRARQRARSPTLYAAPADGSSSILDDGIFFRLPATRQRRRGQPNSTSNNYQHSSTRGSFSPLGRAGDPYTHVYAPPPPPRQPQYREAVSGVCRSSSSAPASPRFASATASSAAHRRDTGLSAAAEKEPERRLPLNRARPGRASALGLNHLQTLMDSCEEEDSDCDDDSVSSTTSSTSGNDDGGGGNTPNMATHRRRRERRARSEKDAGAEREWEPITERGRLSAMGDGGEWEALLPSLQWVKKMSFTDLTKPATDRGDYVVPRDTMQSIVRAAEVAVRGMHELQRQCANAQTVKRATPSRDRVVVNKPFSAREQQVRTHIYSVPASPRNDGGQGQGTTTAMVERRELNLAVSPLHPADMTVSSTTARVSPLSASLNNHTTTAADAVAATAVATAHMARRCARQHDTQASTAGTQQRSEQKAEELFREEAAVWHFAKRVLTLADEEAAARATLIHAYYDTTPDLEVQTEELMHEIAGITRGADAHHTPIHHDHSDDSDDIEFTLEDGHSSSGEVRSGGNTGKRPDVSTVSDRVNTNTSLQSVETVDTFEDEEEVGARLTTAPSQRPTGTGCNTSQQRQCPPPRRALASPPLRSPQLEALPSASSSNHTEVKRRLPLRRTEGTRKDDAKQAAPPASARPSAPSSSSAPASTASSYYQAFKARQAYQCRPDTRPSFVAKSGLLLCSLPDRERGRVLAAAHAQTSSSSAHTSRRLCSPSPPRDTHTHRTNSDDDTTGAVSSTPLILLSPFKDEEDKRDVGATVMSPAATPTTELMLSPSPRIDMYDVTDTYKDGGEGWGARAQLPSRALFPLKHSSKSLSQLRRDTLTRQQAKWDSEVRERRSPRLSASPRVVDEGPAKDTLHLHKEMAFVNLTPAVFHSLRSSNANDTMMNLGDSNSSDTEKNEVLRVREELSETGADLVLTLPAQSIDDLHTAAHPSRPAEESIDEAEITTTTTPPPSHVAGPTPILSTADDEQHQQQGQEQQQPRRLPQRKGPSLQKDAPACSPPPPPPMQSSPNLAAVSTAAPAAAAAGGDEEGEEKGQQSASQDGKSATATDEERPPASLSSSSPHQNTSSHHHHRHDEDHGGERNGAAKTCPPSPGGDGSPSEAEAILSEDVEEIDSFHESN